MITANEIGTLDFANNALLNSLNKPDKSEAVWDLSNINIMDLIISRNQATRRTQGKDGYFQKGIMGNPIVNNVVATVTLNGANLDLTLQDPAYNAFLIGDTITDATAAMNMGTVISCAPGILTIEPAGNTVNTGFSSSLHFVAGTSTLKLFNTSAIRESDAAGSRYYYPEYIDNQTAVHRVNKYIESNDMFQTWPKTIKTYPNPDGGGDFWYSTIDKSMANDIAVEQEMRAIFGQYSSYNGLGGKKNYSRGFKASVLDPKRNGTYRSWSNLFTESQFIDFISESASKQSMASTTHKLIVGRGALQRIQSFSSTGGQIQQIGKLNTIGGAEVKGLNSYEYGIAGFNVQLIMHPLLNNTDFWNQTSTIAGTNGLPRMAFTMMMIDEGMYSPVGSPNDILPAMEKVYYPIGMDNEEVYYYTPGVIGSNLQGADIPEGSMFGGQMKLAVTQKPGVTFGYISNFCYDFMTQRSGWAELAS